MTPPRLAQLAAQTADSCAELETIIQTHLPPRIREMLFKELIEAKVKEKTEMGWNDVHKALEKIETRGECLLCKARMVSCFIACSSCMRCEGCERLIQRECPLCERLVSKDANHCWVCFLEYDDEGDEDDDGSCYFCSYIRDNLKEHIKFLRFIYTAQEPLRLPWQRS